MTFIDSGSPGVPFDMDPYLGVRKPPRGFLADVINPAPVNLNSAEPIVPAAPPTAGPPAPMVPAAPIDNTPASANASPVQGFGDQAPLPAALPPPVPLGPGRYGGALSVPMATGAPAAPPQAQPPLAMTAASEAPSGSLLDRIKNALNRAGEGVNNNANMLLGLGSGFAGAPNFGAGMSRGFAGAQQGLQADQKQMVFNNTINALVARGIPRDAAIAASGNPAVMQQLLTKAFGVKQMQPVEIGQDILGHKIMGSYDAGSGKYYDTAGREIGAPGSAGGASGAPAGSIGAAGFKPEQWAAMTPQERLSHMPPEVQGEIKAIYEGNQSATGRRVQDLLPLVNQVYPNFQQSDYNTKAQMRKEWTSGGPNSPATTLTNGNTAIQHLGELSDLVPKLNNFSGIPFLNKTLNELRNSYKEHSGEATSLSEFKTARDRFAEEATKFYRGVGGSEADVKRALDNLDAAKSAPELSAAIQQEAHLMQDKVNALQSRWHTTMDAAELPIKDFPIIQQKSGEAIRRIEERGAGREPGAAVRQPVQAQAAPPQITKFEDALRLPKGTVFIDPSGVQRVRP
jgi:hypothetical protein